MSMSGGTAISLALQEIGRLFPGEVPNTSEYITGLLLLTNMLDNWSLERLNIPVIVLVSEAWSGIQSGTFGPAGLFGTRFLRVDTVNYVNGGSFPLKIVSEKEYLAHFDRDTASSVTAEEFYYDNQFPVATGYTWPVPTGGDLLVGGWQALAHFPDTTTTVNTPQGYDRAIISNLAMELLSIYAVPLAKVQQITTLAAEAKAAIRAMNASNFQMPGQPPPGGPVNAIPAQPAPAQQ